MNKKDEIYSRLDYDAPIQLIPAPENLFVEYIDDEEIWYSPIVCMDLTKAHHINLTVMIWDVLIRLLLVILKI